VALSFVAANTTTLRLQTHLLIAAYRNPFMAAKAVATLDALSGGRVILGIGAGYLEPEFAALGVDFEERNDLTDEAILTMRAAWTGTSVTMNGRHFAVSANTMLPTPVQLPHPPIWIGGNSKRAIRRAVELGDGWAPMPNPSKSAKRRRSPALESLDDLRGLLDYARAHAATVGRADPLEVVFMPTGLDMMATTGFDGGAVVAELAELAAIGVTYAAISLPGDTRQEFLANIERFGADVVAPAAQVEVGA
jgi:probable F420-dependent oxidoreductase